MNKKRVLKTSKNLLFLFIGLTLLYLAYKEQDLNKLLEDLRGADYSWVVLSMVLGFFAYVARGYRWLILLEPMGYTPKLSGSVASVIIGYFANLAIPRIGEITRCTTMNQLEKIPVNKLFGTVILERVIDFIMLFTVTGLTIVLKLDLFGAFFYDLFYERLKNSLGLGPLILILVVGLLMLVVGWYLFKKYMHKYQFTQKIYTFWLGIKEGLKSVGKLKKKRTFVAYTLIIWILYFFMTYVCFFSLSTTAHLTLVDGLFILAVGGFGMAVPVNGGVGAYHIVVSLGLGILGIAQGPALSFAAIVHTSQTILTMFAGSISLVWIYFLGRKKQSSLANEQL